MYELILQIMALIMEEDTSVPLIKHLDVREFVNRCRQRAIIPRWLIEVFVLTVNQ